jgi:pimeloyl-ACP methyl ester carboxylesterase
VHIVEAGSGPLLVLLHGFPELWYSWRHQLAGLSESFRVVAPDLRGYGETEKPTSGYDLETLGTDVAALISELGEGPAFLAGHDWGGAVAWHLATRHPEKLKKLVILNCPHPSIFQRVLTRSPSQMLRSSYMFFFQIPWLPERLLRLRRAALMERAFRNLFIRADALTDEDIEVYRTAWLRPGALEGGLAYYRTMARRMGARRSSARRPQPIRAPTLLIWGKKDKALGLCLTEGTEKYVDAPFEKLLLGEAGHFVHQEAPDEVNRAIRQFLSSPSGSHPRQE